MANLGALTVTIGGSFASLRTAVSGAVGQLKKLDTAVGNVSIGASLLGAGALAGVVGGLIAVTHQSMQTIDAQYKLAGRLGGTTQAMQTLTVAGNLADVGMEELGKALGTLNARLGEAARTGKGPAYEALHNLGLSAKSLAALDLDERLAAIAEAFQKGGYTASQMSSALRDLGIRNQNILNLLQDGGEQIRSAAQDVKDFGIGVSEINAAKIEMANDAMTRAKFVFSGIGNQISVELAPIIDLVANWFTDLAKQSGGLGPLIQNTFRQIIVAVSSIIDWFGSWSAKYDEIIAKAKLALQLTLAGAQALGGQIINAALTAKSAWEDYGKTAEEINKRASAPSVAKGALEKYDSALAAFTAKAEEAAKNRENIRKRDGASQNALTQEELKKESEKFQRFMEGIAGEDLQLKLKHERQLKELNEFHAKGLASTAAYEQAKRMLEQQFAKETRELVWNNLGKDFATELEQLAFQNQQKLDLINQYEQNRTITEEQAAAYRTALAQKEATDKLKYYADGFASMANVVETSMGHIADLMGEESERGFQLMKAVSIAGAVVKGLQSAVNAWEWGTKFGGPALGATMAGISLAGTGALIAKMMSASSSSKSTGGSSGGGGGGGGASSGGGGGGASSDSGVDRTILIRGLNRNQDFSGEQVRNLIDQIIDVQNDGGRRFILAD